MARARDAGPAPAGRAGQRRRRYLSTGTVPVLYCSLVFQHSEVYDLFLNLTLCSTGVTGEWNHSGRGTQSPASKRTRRCGSRLFSRASRSWQRASSCSPPFFFFMNAAAGVADASFLVEDWMRAAFPPQVRSNGVATAMRPTIQLGPAGLCRCIVRTHLRHPDRKTLGTLEPGIAAVPG